MQVKMYIKIFALNREYLMKNNTKIQKYILTPLRNFFNSRWDIKTILKCYFCFLIVFLLIRYVYINNQKKYEEEKNVTRSEFYSLFFSEKKDNYDFLKNAAHELKRLDFLIQDYSIDDETDFFNFLEYLKKQKELLQQEYIQKSEELNKKHGNNINSEIQEKGKIYSDTKINYLKQYKKYAPEKIYKDFCEKTGLQYEE